MEKLSARPCASLVRDFVLEICLIMVSSSTTSSWIMIKLLAYAYVMRLEEELSGFEGCLSLFKQGKS